MPTKLQIPWLLAALVLAAYTHCVYSHALEAADQHRQLRSAEQPLDNTRATCENESACICKGATLAVVAEAPTPASGLGHLVVESAAAWRALAVDSADWRIRQDHDRPPNSGTLRRAQLQCFLL
jgi:IS5 family transposase